MRAMDASSIVPPHKVIGLGWTNIIIGRRVEISSSEPRASATGSTDPSLTLRAQFVGTQSEEPVVDALGSDRWHSDPYIEIRPDGRLATDGGCHRVVRQVVAVGSAGDWGRKQRHNPRIRRSALDEMADMDAIGETAPHGRNEPGPCQVREVSGQKARLPMRVPVEAHQVVKVTGGVLRGQDGAEMELEL